MIEEQLNDVTFLILVSSFFVAVAGVAFFSLYLNKGDKHEAAPTKQLVQEEPPKTSFSKKKREKKKRSAANKQRTKEGDEAQDAPGCDEAEASASAVASTAEATREQAPASPEAPADSAVQSSAATPVPSPIPSPAAEPSVATGAPPPAAAPAADGAAADPQLPAPAPPQPPASKPKGKKSAGKKHQAAAAPSKQPPAAPAEASDGGDEAKESSDPGPAPEQAPEPAPEVPAENAAVADCEAAPSKQDGLVEPAENPCSEREEAAAKEQDDQPSKPSAEAEAPEASGPQQSDSGAQNVAADAPEPRKDGELQEEPLNAAPTPEEVEEEKAANEEEQEAQVHEREKEEEEKAQVEEAQPPAPPSEAEASVDEIPKEATFNDDNINNNNNNNNDGDDDDLEVDIDDPAAAVGGPPPSPPAASEPPPPPAPPTPPPQPDPPATPPPSDPTPPCPPTPPDGPPPALKEEPPADAKAPPAGADARHGAAAPKAGKAGKGGKGGKAGKEGKDVKGGKSNKAAGHDAGAKGAHRRDSAPVQQRTLLKANGELAKPTPNIMWSTVDDDELPNDPKAIAVRQQPKRGKPLDDNTNSKNNSNTTTTPATINNNNNGNYHNTHMHNSGDNGNNHNSYNYQNNHPMNTMQNSNSISYNTSSNNNSYDHPTQQRLHVLQPLRNELDPSLPSPFTAIKGTYQPPSRRGQPVPPHPLEDTSARGKKGVAQPPQQPSFQSEAVVVSDIPPATATTASPTLSSNAFDSTNSVNSSLTEGDANVLHAAAKGTYRAPGARRPTAGIPTITHTQPPAAHHEGVNPSSRPRFSPHGMAPYSGPGEVVFTVRKGNSLTFRATANGTIIELASGPPNSKLLKPGMILQTVDGRAPEYDDIGWIKGGVPREVRLTLSHPLSAPPSPMASSPTHAHMVSGQGGFPLAGNRPREGSTITSNSGDNSPAHSVSQLPPTPPSQAQGSPNNLAASPPPQQLQLQQQHQQLQQLQQQQQQHHQHQHQHQHLQQHQQHQQLQHLHPVYQAPQTAHNTAHHLQHQHFMQNTAHMHHHHQHHNAAANASVPAGQKQQTQQPHPLQQPPPQVSTPTSLTQIVASRPSSNPTATPPMGVLPTSLYTPYAPPMHTVHAQQVLSTPATTGGPPTQMCKQDKLCSYINQPWHQADFLHTCKLVNCASRHEKRHTDYFVHEDTHPHPHPPASLTTGQQFFSPVSAEPSSPGRGNGPSQTVAKKGIAATSFTGSVTVVNTVTAKEFKLSRNWLKIRVAELKQMLQEELRIPMNTHRVETSDGVQVTNDSSLCSEYGITSGTVLNVVPNNTILPLPRSSHYPPQFNVPNLPRAGAYGGAAGGYPNARFPNVGQGQFV
ncbi:hypothetical protein DIPPA_20107 [Diplonema papillatum]|nr:hypothetical protein DIPPA_20107 [Diplonema papillatum]